jgi:phosphoglucomutase
MFLCGMDNFADSQETNVVKIDQRNGDGVHKRRSIAMDFMKEYEKWLSSPALSEAERSELAAIKNDPKEIEARFYGPLEFGTAGLRGTMYTGLHNMNIHVIRWATQGFADVICAEGEEGKKRGVAICMDCRNHSMEFARAAAEVCAANGIHVRIFEALRPTPELSFAVREYRCQAGINVTASHNPKEYNGYKVYWQDGAQLPPHHADAIAKRLGEIDIFNDIKRMDYEEAVRAGIIEVLKPTRSFFPTLWLKSMTRKPLPKWRTASRWCIPPSTAPATS